MKTNENKFIHNPHVAPCKLSSRVLPCFPSPEKRLLNCGGCRRILRHGNMEYRRRILRLGSIPYGGAPQHCPDMLQVEVTKIGNSVDKLTKTCEFSACNLTYKPTKIFYFGYSIRV